MKRHAILEFLIALIILLMTYASLSKLFKFKVFTFQLAASPFKLLGQFNTFFAISVPAIELLIVALFLFAKTRLLAAKLFIGLMTTFSIYIAAMLLSGVDLPCSCGGVLSQMNWTTHLLFNIGYIIIGIVAYLMLRTKKERHLQAV